MTDIARQTGVSIGTVHRALSDKPGISPGTRERVLAAAAALGYTPNLAARYLSSRRPMRIGVHLPDRNALFWDALRQGIREAAGPFAPAIKVEFQTAQPLTVQKQVAVVLDNLGDLDCDQVFESDDLEVIPSFDESEEAEDSVEPRRKRAS
jgi:ABC-type sugar transport system substrate-binding protein